MTYPFVAKSPSDPTNKGLGYNNREDAEHQATIMNQLLTEYDINPLWNKEFWKSKPEPWIVVDI